jgi:hypothetical protein
MTDTKQHILTGYLDAEAAADAIAAINCGDADVLWINSEEGDLTNALAVADAVRRRKVTVIATGACFGVANIILASANLRYCTPSCVFNTLPLECDDLKQKAILQKSVKRMLGPTLTACTLPDRDKWFDSGAALEAGLVRDFWPPTLKSAQKVVSISLSGESADAAS